VDSVSRTRQPADHALWRPLAAGPRPLRRKRLPTDPERAERHVFL